MKVLHAASVGWSPNKRSRLKVPTLAQGLAAGVPVVGPAGGPEIAYKATAAAVTTTAIIAMTKNIENPSFLFLISIFNSSEVLVPT